MNYEHLEDTEQVFPRLDYVFMKNPQNDKIQIMVNTGLNPKQQPIMEQVKNFLIPRLEKNFATKRTTEAQIRGFLNSFIFNLEEMIYYKKIEYHEYHIWFEGKEIK